MKTANFEIKRNLLPLRNVIVSLVLFLFLKQNTIAQSCVIADQSVSATNTTICSGNSTTITTASSELGVDYYLRDDATNNIIVGPVAGTGGPLSFNTGTLTSTTTYNVYAETGLLGDGGLDFDGVNDYAYAGHVPFQIDNFTIEARIQFKTPGDQIQSIVEFSNMVGVRVENNSLVYGRNNGTSSAIMPLVDGQWYHLALVLRSGVWEMYVDGVLQPTPQYGALWPSYNIELVVGGRGPGESFKGVVDEVRVWTVPRLSSEIDLMKDSCLSGNETGLLVYYNMEEGTGNTLTDLSGNGYNSTIYGATWTSGTGIVCTGCTAEMSTLATVNVGSPNSSSETVTACGSYTWSANSTTYNTSGTYTETLTNVAGCDSIVTLNLTVNPISMTSLPQELVCVGDSALIFGQYESVDGIYYDTLQTTLGCDSILSIELVLLPGYSISQTVVASSGDTVTFPDGSWQVILTDSITYNSSFTTVNGCDSTIQTLVLIRADSPPNGICGGALNFDGINDKVDAGMLSHPNNQFTVEFWANIPVTTPWDHIIENGGVQNGFSAAYRIEVGNEGEMYCAIGNGSNYNDGGNTFGFNAGWQFGEWNHYALTYDGDTAKFYLNSVEKLVFTTGGIDITQGDGTLLFSSYQGTSRFYNGMLDEVQIWDSERTNEEIVTDMSGQLTGAEPDLLGYWSFDDRIGSVVEDLSPQGQNGTLINMDTLMDWVTVSGASLHTAQVLTICSNDSVVVGSTVHNTAGLYTDTVLTSAGCDSVVITDLSVLPAYNSNFPSVTICPGDSALIFGNYETVAGMYVNNMTALNGCDSVETINLIIAPIYNNNLPGISICEGDSALIFGNYETVAGTYVNSLTTVNGCDSTETVELTVIAIDTSVTNSSPILTANQNGATYQWVDCNNGNSSISGETGQSFTATSNGSYAVQITLNGCTETSSCHDVNGIGIEEQLEDFEVNIFPNPNNGQFTLEINSAASQEVIVEIRTILGQVVQTTSLITNNKHTIDVGNVESGIYLVIITASNQLTYRKFTVR